MLVGDIDGIRNEAIKRLANHRKIGRILEKLKSGRVHIEAILEKKDDREPWEAPESLNPIP